MENKRESNDFVLILCDLQEKLCEKFQEQFKDEINFGKMC